MMGKQFSEFIIWLNFGKILEQTWGFYWLLKETNEEGCWIKDWLLKWIFWLVVPMIKVCFLLNWSAADNESIDMLIAQLNDCICIPPGMAMPRKLEWTMIEKIGWMDVDFEYD